MGINRNILECKGLLIEMEQGGYDVLIETYWNVKIGSRKPLKWRCCINRNILECKGYCYFNIFNNCFCINRNILECKGAIFSGIYYSQKRINRNILECKVNLWLVSGTALTRY